MSATSLQVLPAPTKSCTKCKQVKPLTEFHRSPNSRDGRVWKCNLCACELTRIWRKKNHAYAISSKRKARRQKPKEHMLWRAQNHARIIGVACTITLKDLEIPDFCPVLNVRLNPLPKSGKAQPNSASIDRIDSTKGYIPGNVWVISLRANQIKRDATWQELEALANSVRKKLFP